MRKIKTVQTSALAALSYFSETNDKGRIKPGITAAVLKFNRRTAKYTGGLE